MVVYTMYILSAFEHFHSCFHMAKPASPFPRVIHILPCNIKWLILAQPAVSHIRSLDCILDHWNIDNPKKTCVCVYTLHISLKAVNFNGKLSLCLGSRPEQRNGKEDMGDLQMSWLNMWWAETWKWFILLELLRSGTGMMGSSTDHGSWTLESSPSVQYCLECG